jgi:hypothetical protein
MTTHNPQRVVSDPEGIYFSKIGRTISGFINLMAILIYAIFTGFDGKYYI